MSPSGGGDAPGVGAAADRYLQVYAARRYAVLFYLLLATLGVSPLLTALRFSTDLLQILLALSLLVAVLDVSGPRWRWALIVLAAVAIALRIAPASAVGAQVSVSALVLGTGIGLLAAGSAMRFALSGRAVGGEHVYAALSAYLLAGLVFGVLYWAITAAWPGSFVDTAGGTPAVFPLSTAIYFSFVTLATLGYGDVLPRNEMARGLAVLEAVGGQLFVAVTIAHLVSARAQAPAADAEQSRQVSSRSLRGR